jgi:hypothetical protein
MFIDETLLYRTTWFTSRAGGKDEIRRKAVMPALSAEGLLRPACAPCATVRVGGGEALARITPYGAIAQYNAYFAYAYSNVLLNEKDPASDGVQGSVSL